LASSETIDRISGIFRRRNCLISPQPALPTRDA